MSPIDGLIIYLIHPALSILVWIVIIGIVMSWLINFNVINTHNQFVSTIYRITHAVTEPLLRPIRSVLPTLGGLDFSPIVLVLLIGFVQGYVLAELVRLF
ncbi:YggT family protein [Maricaulis sp.]|uniref:YggT family protein n=1 Tax=Maricaulis sp. TaxID=1486257 RepID=UPI001B0C7098|nr:YggT family protein [Maricaulis sp.]MBO6795979.1 YggT family protein [Maricaulis sp.]